MSNSTITCAIRDEAIPIALRVLLIPNSTGYPCYHSLIVGQLFKKVICNCSYTVSFTHYLLISGLAWNQYTASPDPLKNIQSNMGRASRMTLSQLETTQNVRFQG